MTESEICPICKNPKLSSNQGSFTQWIQACTCQSSEEDIKDIVDNKTINICQDCGKRVNDGRVGSITQFIFRSDTCQCERPNLKGEHFETTKVPPAETEKVEPAQVVEYSEKIDQFPYERFTPISILGEGSSGTIYLARDKLLDTNVAVKMLHSLESKQLISFHEEAKATSKLTHPSIVKVMDFGTGETQVPYMVLEYVKGISLETLLARQSSLSWNQCLEIFQQILEAISYAHENGIYHRDIKPSNILLSESSTDQFAVKIIDFGIAKIIDKEIDETSTKLAGTPLYMSPDIASGERFDARCDVYSIGCMLFECLTGKPPYDGRTALETISLHAHSAIPNVNDFTKEELPTQVEHIVKKALAKNALERYQSAKEFHAAISSVEADVEEIETKEESKPEPDRSNHSKLLLTLLLVAVIPTLIIFVLPKMLGKNSVQELVLGSDSIEPETPAEVEEVPPDISDVEDELEKPIWSKTSNLVKGYFITDESFKELARRFPKTKTIRVMAPSYITGKGLAYIKKKKRILSLSISSKIFGLEGFKLLPRFSRLRDLKIIFSESLNDECFSYILKLPNLENLELRNLNPLPPNAVSILSKSKTIEVISFKGSKGLNIPDLKKLEEMTQLKVLKLSGSSFSDQDIPLIANLNISNLGIDQTEVTDKGLMQLVPMKQLKYIGMSKSNDKITLIGIRKFLSLRPKCNVTIYDEKGRVIELDNPVYQPVDRALEDLKSRERDLIHNDY